MNGYTGEVPWDLSGRALSPEQYKAWLAERTSAPSLCICAAMGKKNIPHARNCPGRARKDGETKA